MGRASRIAVVFGFGVAAGAAAACSGEEVTRMPLDLDPTVTQVIPFDTATSGGGDAEADSVTSSNSQHACTPDDSAADKAGDVARPPLPPCSTDPVIQ